MGSEILFSQSCIGINLPKFCAFASPPFRVGCLIFQSIREQPSSDSWLIDALLIDPDVEKCHITPFRSIHLAIKNTLFRPLCWYHLSVTHAVLSKPGWLVILADMSHNERGSFLFAWPREQLICRRRKKRGRHHSPQRVIAFISLRDRFFSHSLDWFPECVVTLEGLYWKKMVSPIKLSPRLRHEICVLSIEPQMICLLRKFFDQTQGYLLQIIQCSRCSRSGEDPQLLLPHSSSVPISLPLSISWDGSKFHSVIPFPNDPSSSSSFYLILHTFHAYNPSHDFVLEILRLEIQGYHIIGTTSLWRTSIKNVVLSDVLHFRPDLSMAESVIWLSCSSRVWLFDRASLFDPRTTFVTPFDENRGGLKGLVISPLSIFKIGLWFYHRASRRAYQLSTRNEQISLTSYGLISLPLQGDNQ